MNILLLVALVCYVHPSDGNALQHRFKRQADANSSLIVGGYDVIINQFPFAVHLQIHYGFSDAGCGGTLLLPHFVLTAGHCIYPYPDSITISVGSSKVNGGTEYHTSIYIVHSRYISEESDYDIGLVESKIAIILNHKSVRKAVLAETDTKVTTDSILIVIGWGRLAEKRRGNSPSLKAVNVTVIDHDRCQTIYRDKDTISERSFCAGVMEGGKGICDGDSGGPAVNSLGQVVGVVAGSVGCARVDFPAIYTNVAALREWIREKAKV